jgi:prophage regulatory protein
MHPNGTQRPHRILRNRAVCDKAGFRGSSTLYAAMDNEGFPRPIALGPRSVGWIEEEVDAWIEARRAKRDEGWRRLGDVAAEVVEKVRSW